jgi:hypothetical protein
MMGLCRYKPVYQGGIRPLLRITMTIDAEKRSSVLFMSLHYNDAEDIVKGRMYVQTSDCPLTQIRERIQSVDVHRTPWK